MQQTHSSTQSFNAKVGVFQTLMSYMYIHLDKPVCKLGCTLVFIIIAPMHINYGISALSMKAHSHVQAFSCILMDKKHSVAAC